MLKKLYIEGYFIKSIWMNNSENYGNKEIWL